MNKGKDLFSAHELNPCGWGSGVVMIFKLFVLV